MTVVNLEAMFLEKNAYAIEILTQSGSKICILSVLEMLKVETLLDALWMAIQKFVLRYSLFNMSHH